MFYSSKKLKITLLVIFAVASFSFGASSVLADHVSYHPLVPCGVGGGPECTQCDLLKLGKNIFDLVLLFIVPVIGSLLIVIGGFILLLGGVNPGTVNLGKSIIRSTIIGAIIILISWTAVNFLLRSLAGESNVADEWWKLTCQSTIVEDDDENPDFPNPDLNEEARLNVDLATQIIGTNQISRSTNATCGGGNHASANLFDLQQGKLPAVCSPSCASGCQPGGSSGLVTINPNLLRGLVQVSGGFQFTITSLTTGPHSQNSAHYRGEAADLQPRLANGEISTDPQDWVNLRRALNSYGGQAICEDKQTSRDVPSCDLNRVSHIHWTLSR